MRETAKITYRAPVAMGWTVSINLRNIDPELYEFVPFGGVKIHWKLDGVAKSLPGYESCKSDIDMYGDWEYYAYTFLVESSAIKFAEQVKQFEKKETV